MAETRLPPNSDAERLAQTIEIIRRSKGPFSQTVCLRLVDELATVTAERDRLRTELAHRMTVARE